MSCGACFASRGAAETDREVAEGGFGGGFAGGHVEGWDGMDGGEEVADEADAACEGLVWADGTGGWEWRRCCVLAA